MIINPPDHADKPNVVAYLIADYLGLEPNLTRMSDKNSSKIILTVTNKKTHHQKLFNGPYAPDIILRLMEKLLNDCSFSWFNEFTLREDGKVLLGIYEQGDSGESNFEEKSSGKTIPEAVVNCTLNIIGEWEVPEELITD